MNVLFIVSKSVYEERMSMNHNTIMSWVEKEYDVVDKSDLINTDIKKYDIIVNDTTVNAFSENIINYKGNKILTGKFHQDLWQIYESGKRNIDSEYDFVINRYHDEKTVNGLFCKEVKKYYIPHHQDYDTFKDWGLKKEYDMILFGNHSFRKLYPFRWKLFKMLKREMRNNDKYNLRYIRHPGYSNESAKNAIRGAELSKEINKSWLCVCTSESHGPYNKRNNPYDSWYSKYMETSLSGSVIVGTMPNQAKEIYQDDYIKLRWSMSNSEIMKRINDALSDKEKLSEMANRVRQRYFEANMDMPNYTIKLNKIFEDVLNPKT